IQVLPALLYATAVNAKIQPIDCGVSRKAIESPYIGAVGYHAGHATSRSHQLEELFTSSTTKNAGVFGAACRNTCSGKLRIPETPSTKAESITHSAHYCKCHRCSYVSPLCSDILRPRPNRHLICRGSRSLRHLRYVELH